MHTINPDDAQRIDDRNLYAPLRTNDELQLHRPVWPLFDTLPACCGNCGQGRKLCVTPQACCVPAAEIEDGEPRRQRIPEGGGIVIVALIVTVLATLVAMFR